MTTLRAIGIVRVSQRRGVDSEHSPQVQVRALLKHAEGRYELRPEDIWDENIDANGNVRKVSGSWGLEERPKLAAAVEAVEAGTHQVILAERFDRLFRPDHNENISVQRVVVRRVESAGGRLEPVRGTAISYATAESGLQADINEAVSRYTRRTAMERSWDAVEVAVEEGKVPWSQTAPGYTRDKDSRLHPNPERAPIIEAAFRMRLDGSPIQEVRQYLARHGIKRSYHGTMHLLRDRIYIGEIHFGEHTPNLSAHEPIIDRDLFDAVQGKKIPRGRKPNSERLLARLGVLRCGSCSARMVVGTANHSVYGIYRCPPTGDCTQRVTISAEIAETVVVEEVQRLIRGIRERVSTESAVEEAECTLMGAQVALDAATRIALEAGVSDEPAAIERLTKLREARDAARERYDHALADVAAESIVLSADDWDVLSLKERRELIRAVIEQVTVSPVGRGAERLTISQRQAEASSS